MGWFFYHDPAVVAPVSDEDPATGQPFEGLFLGGVQSGQEDTDWTLFNLDIEPMSMRRVDSAEQQRRAEYCFQMAVTIGPLILQMPWINWQALLDLIGEAHNIPDFARMVLNQAGLQFIQYGVPYAMMRSGSPGELALPALTMSQVTATPHSPRARPGAVGSLVKPSGNRPLPIHM